jgi:NTE family protein
VAGFRLGLALSGGGFRASFFHIGVLAYLAEQDLLRNVEVISTVSGGSIIGALYYLHVRKLLMNKLDHDIQCEDYVNLVGKIEIDFQQAISKNLRMRALGNPLKNLKMYAKDYSRSNRIAEIYTEFLYAPMVDEPVSLEVPFPDLMIFPKVDVRDEAGDFHPFRRDGKGQSANDLRKNKVPALILNTTTLNTGHNFQFTASFLGEPLSQRQENDLDKNLRLRRAYFRDLPIKYQKLPLGIAVAASAAVPGLFYPLALTDLYPHITPQLVDGGVHDNQGTEGLLDGECTHLIVSDASGQMGDEHEPDTRTFSVLKRSSDISTDRIREEEYKGLVLRKKTGVVQEFVFFHLKEKLQQEALTWIGGEHKKEPVPPPLSYGVDRGVQQLIAGIRTDLDSFTEVESHALMADGYLIAKNSVDKYGPQKFVPNGTNAKLFVGHTWGFLDVQAYMENPQKDPRFCEQLEVGGSQFFKVFKLLPWLKWTGVIFLIAVLCLLILFFICHANNPVPGVEAVFKKINTFGALGMTLGMLVLYVLLYNLPQHWRWVRLLWGLPRRIILGVGLAVFGSMAVWIHLLIFDRLFLWQGKVSRLK